jgi:DNA-binding PadR family transcriptional regulator
VVNLTQLIVLGMLEMRPMSGYDIQMTLQQLDVEKWSGVLVGSIYHALKKLETDGYLEIDSIEQTGLRQKAIYKITDKGSLYLKELIFESLKKSSAAFPTTFYSAITFMDNIPKEQARTALKEQKELLEKEMEALEKGLLEKEEALNGNMPPIVKSSFKNMFGIVKLQKEYVEELLCLI